MNARRVRFPVAAMFIVSACSLGLGLSACSDSPPKPPDPDPQDVYFGPTITVMDPARSAMLQQGTLTPATVEVSGVVCDSFQAITDFVFDDNPMTLAGTRPGEPFTAQASSPWGLTILHGQILNDLGWQGHLAHSFLRSPEYLSPATQDDAAARAPRAVFTQISPDLLDDGDPDLDDVASIAEYAMNHFFEPEWMGLPMRVASADFGGIGYTVDLVDFTPGPTALGLEFIDGGIRTRFRMDDATAELKVCGKVFFTVCNNTTIRDFCAAVDLDALFSLDDSDSIKIQVAEPDVSVSMTLPDCPLPTLYCAGWNLALKDLIAREIGKKVAKELEKKLPKIQASILTRISTPDSIPIALDPPFDVSLGVQSAVDFLDITPERARIASRVQVWPTTALAAHSRPVGSIVYGGPLPVFDPEESLAGSGIKGDLLNQVLWAIWQGGGFDITSQEIIAAGLIDADKLEGVEFSIVSNLPPVLMQSVSTGAVSIGWGDMYIDLTLPETTQAHSPSNGITSPIYASTGDPFVRAYASAQVVGQIAFHPETNTMGVVIDSSQTQIYVQVAALHEPAIRGWVNNYLHSTLRTIAPAALESVLSNLGLPKADLDAIVLEILGIPAFPPGQEFFNGRELRLVDALPHLQEGYYCLTGGMEAVEEH